MPAVAKVLLPISWFLLWASRQRFSQILQPAGPPEARAQLSLMMPWHTNHHAAHTFVAAFVAGWGAVGRIPATGAGADSVLAAIGHGEDEHHKHRCRQPQILHREDLHGFSVPPAHRPGR